MLTFNFVKFPVLETERLLLKAITMDFADDIFRQRSKKEVMQYIARPLLQSKIEAEDLVKNYEFLFEQRITISWAVVRKEDSRMMGTIGFPRVNKENHRGEVGYSLDPDYWYKGYMSEALKKVLAYGFEELHFHSIEAMIHPDNKSSSNLVLKHGFVKEAHFKQYTYFNGEFLDVEVYSLLSK
jgi:ribosomal-protein-alanine N-acetyltransferase